MGNKISKDKAINDRIIIKKEKYWNHPDEDDPIDIYYFKFY